MKKSLKALAVLLAGMMLFTACGTSQNETAAETNVAETDAEGNVIITRGEFNVADYVTISGYKEIKIKKADITASDEELQSEIDNLIESGKTMKEVKRAAKEGDTVNIDYEGKIDGETFDGGSYEGYDLVLGSNSFIEGFEDGLIGVKAGKTVTLDLKFPDEYPNDPSKAGAAVEFKVTVNSVSKTVTPEYNDELVQDNTDYKTTKEFEEKTREKLEDSKRTSAIEQATYALATYSEELPKTLVEFYQKRFADYYDSMFSAYYGTSLEAYLEETGSNLDEFYEQVGVETIVKNELVWKSIAEQENIKAEGEAYDAYIQEQADNYGITSEEYLEQMTPDEAAYVYCLDQAMKLVNDSAVVED